MTKREKERKMRIMDDKVTDGERKKKIQILFRNYLENSWDDNLFNQNMLFEKKTT